MATAGGRRDFSIAVTALVLVMGFLLAMPWLHGDAKVGAPKALEQVDAQQTTASEAIGNESEGSASALLRLVGL